MKAGRRTLSQSVAEALLLRVRDGDFRPGDRLPTEKELMASYDVGRNAAREAVQALVTMGLVEVRPGRGATLISVESNGIDSQTFSALLDDRAVDELYELRTLLEVDVAKRAADRATTEEVEDLRNVDLRFKRACASGQPTEVISALDDEFHHTLAIASHNSLYLAMLEAVSHRVSHARRIGMTVPWALEHALDQHGRLVDAVAAHDIHDAETVMTEHMQSAVAAIREGRRIALDESH